MTRSTYTAVDGDGGACGVASGYRIGRHTLAEHSCAWHRHLMCVGGCGTCADLEHVTTGQCKAMVGRDVYCTNVANCLDALAKRLPKPEKPSAATPMRDWMCPARTTVLQAKRGITAKMGETVRQEDWQALRKVIAGVLPEPIALQTLRQRDQKRAAERASEAICELQRVVHEALLGRWEATGERRRAADAARAEDAQWCKLADEADAAEAARHARMQVETKRAEDSVRAAEAASAQTRVEADRRASARQGDAMARTRAARQGRDGEDAPAACPRDCDERARRVVCASCASHLHQICDMCRQGNEASAWCPACSKLQKQERMCAVCVSAIRATCAECIDRWWGTGTQCTHRAPRGRTTTTTQVCDVS